LVIDDRYRLVGPLRPLDSHGSTEVFEVEDGTHTYVMKVLKKADPKLVQLFQREAELLRFVKIPGIPKTPKRPYFRVSLSNGLVLHCLVIEKIPGQNLSQWLEAGHTLSQAQALDWLKQVLETLVEVHQRGVFHRDIKPSNIILRPDGRLVLIDFGAIRNVTATYLAKLGASNGIDSDLTQVISAGYSAPEQLSGRAVPQSDLYALGRTFVHLLTRVHPCDLTFDHSQGRLIWHDRAPHVSKYVATFIDELMALSPEERPKSATYVLSYLSEQQLKRRRLIRLVRRISLTTLGIGVAVNYILLPFAVEYWFNRGRTALMEQDLLGAIADYKRALMLDPKDLKILNNLALACKLQKDYDCALKNYDRGLAVMGQSWPPADPETIAILHYNRGALLEDIREFELAAQAYQLVLETDTAIQRQAANNLARLQIWREQNTALAIPLILETLETNPEADLRVGLYKNLGWAHLLEGNLDMATNALEQAIKLDPQLDPQLTPPRAAPFCLLAKIQQQQQQPSAQENWQKCRDYNAENLPEVETWQNDAIWILNSQGSI
jgi:tetratricopeptide (TPR) repeat protein/predicted Ser/Thr protein kinase